MELEKLGCKLIVDFEEVFTPIPHVNHFPTKVYCSIESKHVTKIITSKLFSTP